MGLDLLGSYLVLDDYELFCVNHLGFRPYPEQIEISDKIDKHNYVLVMMARQSGKSYGISSKILHYALNHSNIRILIFTPKKDQAIDIIFGHIRRWVERSDFLRSFVAVGENGRLKIYKDGYIEFVNGCSIRCLGADARSNIVGYTGDMVVMDEAQSISDMVVDQYIMPMLGSIKNPKVIKIGTPRGRNHFFRSWRDGKLGRDWVVLEYPWQKCHNLNKAYVEQQRRTNRHFSSEYELQWQTNVRSFFTAQELSRLFVSYDIDKYEKEYKLGNKLFKEVYCGIDWGKSNDNTVISFFARDGNLIRCIGLYILDTGVDYGEQIDRVKELLLLYKPLVTYMDVTGGASSVIGDSFNSLGLYVEGVIFTNKYKSSVLYANLRLAVQNGLVVMPKNDMAELQFYELEETDLASGFTKISHPRGGHDDVPDSVALALLGFSDYIESVSGRRITGYDLGFDIILEGVDRDKIEKEEDDVDLGNRGFKEVW